MESQLGNVEIYPPSPQPPSPERGKIHPGMLFDLPWIIILIQFVIILALVLGLFAFFLTRSDAPPDVPYSTRTYQNFELQTIAPSSSPLTFRRRYKTTSEAPQAVDFDFSEDVVPAVEVLGTTPTTTKREFQKSSVLEFESEHEPMNSLETFEHDENLRAAVFSSSHVCSEVGKSILVRGGNAVDSAIAVSFCLMGALPNKASLAGGMMMTVKGLNGTVTTVMASLFNSRMSVAPCPTALPPYYTTLLSIVAAISAPINLFALYLVWFKSPKLGVYKYGIFHLQLATFFTELEMSVICPAYYFFPMIGGINVGKFVKQSWSTHTSVTIYAFFLASELPAIVWCFIYRHNSILDLTNNMPTRRPIKIFIILLAELFPIAMCFFMYMSEITPAQAHSYLKNNYPQCLFLEQNELFVVYDIHANLWIAFTGFGAVIAAFLGTILCATLASHTIFLLKKLRHRMSPKTFQLHRTALISLSLQVIVPSVFLLVPVCFVFYVIAFDLLDFQGTATNVTMLISCHSVTSSIVMIVTIPRHRKLVLNFFLGPCGRSIKTRTTSLRVAGKPTLKI